MVCIWARSQICEPYEARGRRDSADEQSTFEQGDEPDPVRRKWPREINATRRGIHPPELVVVRYRRPGPAARDIDTFGTGGNHARIRERHAGDNCPRRWIEPDDLP